ncbi:putative quinol monooxygenase [Caenimonas koreensis]|uniref:putative quinol monooxygenase n=1 Tax=Caenimonas koreensis TaxID=367474 RepID=UPI003783F26C
MIVVVGSALILDGRGDEALALSLDHVRRSRAEPGCLSHSVHHDAENPRRLVFVEEWQDLPTLQMHFQVPESRKFAKALASLCDGQPSMQVYESETVDPFRQSDHTR